MLTVFRLDENEIPTATCGYRGCEEPAYMWGCKALDNGYVDACEAHAVNAMRFTLNALDIDVENL